MNTLSDMVPVRDPEKQMSEFLFECMDEPWISKCQDSYPRRFLMFIDEEGNFLEEVINKRDISKNSILVSGRRKAEKPNIQEIMETVSYPSFLFQLERLDFSSGLFYLISSSGKLLVADDQWVPELMLREDHCTLLSNATDVSNSSEPANSSENSTSSAKTSEIDTGLSDVSPKYDCDQAKWTLGKIDDLFLVIQSAFKEGFFLHVNNSKIVTLNGLKEKMTGIKSSFLVGPIVTLDRSAEVDQEEGIEREAYGDVLLHYNDRRGNVQEGYICDYEWGLEDANSVCRHLKYEAGVPTYDGRYSSTKSPVYAVSGVHCEQENITECRFRTICGNNDPNCLVQQSMKQFKGKGYACNKGSKTDAAGVVCGNQTTINKLLQETIKCNRGSVEKDKKSVAQMYSLQNQVKLTGSKMFENKHWSEYLLPMPMAISLMSTLLLVSSQFDRDVELTKPSSGKWDHLKYDWLQANLLFLSNNVKNNFELSNSNMGVIKVNSRKVHTNMKLAVQYAFSMDEFDSKTLLPRHLRYIQEDAATSTMKAEEVSDAFKCTGKIIEELLEALKNSESFHGNVKKDLENVIAIVKQENKKDEETFNEEKEKKEKYDKKVEKSRKDFFKAANDAMDAQCVNGVTECKTECKNEAAQNLWEKQRKCSIETKELCVRQEEYCAKEEKYCAEEESYCASYKTVEYDCNVFGTDCETRQACTSTSSKCARYEKKCAQTKLKCMKHETICSKPSFTIAGSYCQDNGNRGICSPCEWITEVKATMNSVTHVQMQLQMDAMSDGASYAGVTSVIEDTVGVLNVFKQDLENYSKWKESPEKNHLNISDEVSSNSIPVSKETSTISTDEVSISEETANKNIRTQLQLMQLQVISEIELLKEIKLPIAKKVCDWLLQLRLLLDELLKRKVQLIREITEAEKIKFSTLITQGKSLVQEAGELRAKKEISFKPGSAADHKTGDLAEIHTENLITRRTTEKKIESLTNKMRNSLREILKKDIKGQDLRATIEYLGECFKHLNFLQLQWDSLKMFFKKLVDFLENMKTDINRMKDFYTDIGMKSLDQPLSKSFKERLQTKIVEGLANNIYVMRIAFFYTKIAEDGLLDRMSMIGNNLKKIESKAALDRYKKYIQDDAVMTQERIKAEISKEEAKINDKITNEVSMIKNDLACKLEDRKDLHAETILSLEAMRTNIDKLLSSENDEKNVKDLPEEDLETMTLFAETKLAMVNLVEEEEEEDVDDFMDW